MKIFLTVAAALVFLFSSCKKENTLSSGTGHPENTLVVSFDVQEQVNVSNYKIELSETGNNFISASGIIVADNLALSKYSVNVDITNYQKAIYMRIKATDIDGQVDYSKVVVARAN